MDYSPEEKAYMEFFIENCTCETTEKCSYWGSCNENNPLCQQILTRMGKSEALKEEEIDLIKFWFEKAELWKNEDCTSKRNGQPCYNSDKCEDGLICEMFLVNLGCYLYEYDVVEKEIQKIIVNDLRRSASMMDWHTAEELRYYSEKPLINVGAPDILLIGADTKTLYVVELKRGEASREHVGQLASYVGWYREHPEDRPQGCKDKDVKGILLARKFSKGAEYALKVCEGLESRHLELHAKINE
jgi:hypothetical protein